MPTDKAELLVGDSLGCSNAAQEVKVDPATATTKQNVVTQGEFKLSWIRDVTKKQQRS